MMDNRGGRRILIVDDDPDWHGIIGQAVHDILRDIGREGDYEVMYAKDDREALDLLKRHTYALVSMDINLSGGEEASEGFKLLDYLRSSAPDICSIVVSGESRSEFVSKSLWGQYIRAGFQKYNILWFFEKDAWDELEFKATVKGILLYRDALGSFKEGDLQKAISNWEGACKAAPELRERFQNVGALIEERARSEGTDLVTGLPAGKMVDSKLRELVKAAKPWGILYIRVHGLEEYYETYGHIVGDSALKTIGRFLKDEVGAGAFVGYAERGLFAVIVKDQDPELLKTRLVDRFNREHAMDANLYPYQDRGEKARTLRPGVPELKLAIRMVSSKDGPFPDIREISRMGSGLAP
jgi:GGDEF domain-containing protein/CheY-like chemotaxis protein